VDFLRAAWKCDPLELPKVIELLMDTGELPDGAGLELLEVFLRDVSVFKCGASGGEGGFRLSFHRFSEPMTKLITSVPQADFEGAVRVVEEARGRLAKGYTRDLTLIVMAIRLKETLGQRSK
jgi:hypothetical protein